MGNAKHILKLYLLFSSLVLVNDNLWGMDKTDYSDAQQTSYKANLIISSELIAQVSNLVKIVENPHPDLKANRLENHDSSKQLIAQLISDSKTKSNKTTDDIIVKSFPLYKEQLLGLFVDSKDFGTVSIIERDEEWFLPIKIFSETADLTLKIESEKLYLTSPKGQLEFSEDEFIKQNQEIYLSRESLKDKLKFEIIFDQLRYALMIYLPWNKVNQRQQLKIIPDIVPHPLSLRRLRADIIHEKNSSTSRTSAEYRLGGAAYNGIWEIEYLDKEDQDGRFTNYNWVTGNAFNQGVIGYSLLTPNNLVEGSDISGVQYAFSNHAIDKSKSRRLDIESFYQNIGGTNRRITGFTEPGSIVQLLINGRFLQEKRSGLDGYFEFNEARLATQNFNDIEVLVLNRQRTRVIERIDYSQHSNDRILNKGQHLVYGGLGQRGNILESVDKAHDGDLAGTLLYRYGISDYLTVEANYLDNGKNEFQTIGLSTVLFKLVESNFQIARQDENQAYEANLRASGEIWRLTAKANQFDGGFKNDSQGRRYEREFDFDLYPTDRLNLSLIGLDRKNEVDEVSYVLPAFAWYDRKWSLRVRPDSNEKYRVTTKYNTKRVNLRYDYFDSQHFINTEYLLNSQLSLLSSYVKESDEYDVFELGFDWYPNTKNDNRANLHASMLANENGDTGYNVSFEQNLMPGLFARIEVHKQPEIMDQIGSSDTQYLFTLTGDIAYTGSQFVSAESTEPRLNAGSISGKIIYPDTFSNKFKNLKRITLQIDGRRRVVPLRGRSFFIDYVPIGIRKVKLDGKHLPIELSPIGNENYWVKVNPGSVSHMRFNLQVRLGFSGRIVDENGNALAGVTIEIADLKKTIVAKLTSDRFGLYRVDSIVPSSYTLTAYKNGNKKQASSRLVELTDEYLFNQDVVL